MLFMASWVPTLLPAWRLQKHSEVRGILRYHIVDLDTDILIGGINTVAVGFIRDNAEAIMKVSPISYVKDAELRGSLFDLEDTSGVISSVYTNFFVDHTEPLEALAWVREGLDWPLGELLDGYEFLLMIEVRRRDRSRSRSTSRPQSGS